MGKGKKKQTTTRLLIRKFFAGTDAKELVGLLVHHLRGINSTAEAMKELVACLLSLQDELKGREVEKRWSWVQIINLFEKAAVEKGIPAEEFYPMVVELLLSQRESDEQAKAYPGSSTREKVLGASLDVFSEKGFHQATVDEIAERAGVGKGTLYRYFANKEALFNEVVNLRLQELERKAEAVLDGQDDVLTLISKYMRIYFEFFDKNQRFYRVVVQEQLDFNQRIQDLYVEKIMRRVPLLKRKITEGRQQDILKEVNFHTVFYGVMGFMHGVIQRWLAHDCSYSLMGELPTVEQVLFYGFVRQKNVSVK